MEHIDSELILLTDADVEFAPTCVSSAVAELQLRQLDLLSIYPQFEFMTFCETMLVPIYVVGGALLLARPSNKFNAVIALAFPCMSIQFAASCLQAIYLFLAKGRLQWLCRSQDSFAFSSC